MLLLTAKVPRLMRRRTSAANVDIAKKIAKIFVATRLKNVAGSIVPPDL
jgi:hypothetical protein